ncbi:MULTISPECIES: fumarate reductase/succinate dehydrogenase flavoprotein subunit [Chryseobacterium]|uniref:fumarate reductase/succinate dehydrogenase flavoprotein subunit n=1 Tax=Chryseobacterium TaxID=59732 RepID=UPI00195A0C67|nr:MULTISPECIES: fumarate reductase/succinate dehydrogenase flavoprotein subunit [Chryseobacterium]MBM7420347.1 succinate dehydrogenase / fumarate reductase flavoprotein subunit [Chryseobacterium sp. JUb44]MDH6210294.1 succinate dehydrogenase / fumarate reductase flavoprotein subunit [Chryseobacterium sp. BIGb0186]WSO09004.1 fumarate reductase/succinate dehydrogenase flavoprotein subunit [Chryseobacterium scophthalmum]
MILDSKIPEGSLEQKWDNYKKKAKLVNPANRKKLDVIVVGTGLAGSSIAASLGEMGYNVKSFCFQDSPRRAHSVAAQGGVNAAKNYKNDGDSVYRMFVDTLKGGDFRAREANVYRMAECSLNLIDQAVAQGVPFGREYGGYLNNRSFGGVQVSRTFYARGQTGQQLLLGAYQALMRQVGKKSVQLFSRHEMLDLVMIDGKARGIIVRNLDTGEIERHTAHAVVLATGGYGKIYYLSTLAMGCNGSAIWRAHKKGALMASPSWIQVHPTSLPQSGDYQSKLTLMSESLRNDGRIWVPLKENETRKGNDIPENERDYYLERRYPAFGNLAPRDISSRAAKERIDAGFGIGPLKNAVYLDFSKAIKEQGKEKIQEKYGNLFDMYLKITGYNAYEEPMMISPSAHFSMGGLWVDYELMTTIPGLFALGEANFADHGANRLGANSLLQASVDGYFIAPYTIANYLSNEIHTGKISTENIEFDKAENQVKQQIESFISINGTKTVDYFHKTLGKLLYDYCGLARNEDGLKYAIEEIRKLKQEFYKDVKVSGQSDTMNSELEKAGRVADYFEIGELMCYDALTRNESCGAHFREEYQTPDGEALRNDAEFQFISAWAWKGQNNEPELIKEPLIFEEIQPTVRSYK